MAVRRQDRDPVRWTNPLERTMSYVERRTGLPDEARERRIRREEQRAPRGRR